MHARPQKRSVYAERGLVLGLKQIDLQDALLVIGTALIVAGVGAWSRPAASIMLGVFCLAAVRFTDRAPRGQKPEGKS